MKRKNGKLIQRQQYLGYVYILPFIIGFFMMFVGPLIGSLSFSLSEMTLTAAGIETEFIGLENYRNIMTVDPQFNQHLITVLQELLWLIPAVVVYSIFIANLLNKKFTGRSVVRAIFFLPVLANMVFYTPIEAVAASDTNSLMNRFVNNISLSQYLSSLNLSASLTQTLLDMADNIYAVIGITGIQIFLFLAALQAIPDHLYEASAIEGASAWDNLWKITVPMISPYIIICVIYTVVDSFYREGNVIATYIRTITLQQSQYASGAAAAWIYMLSILLLIFVISFILKKVTIKFD